MSRRTNRWILASAAAVLALVGVTACGDDEVAETTSTTAPASASSAPTTAADPPAEYAYVVWPPADGSVSYDDPVVAATAFATELIGFRDPVVGEFQEGDSRSGEVEVRPSAEGPVTTVLVRQVGADEAWSVLGAATDSIRPTMPAPASAVTSPMDLGGTSTAFEGTVQVAIRDRSGVEALAEGFVTGGANGDIGPFEDTLAFSAPSTPTGSVVFFTVSMEDGAVREAAVVPVQFGTAEG